MLKYIQKKCQFPCDISRTAIYLTLGTHQNDFNSYMCFQGGTAAIHVIAICKQF